MPPRSQRSAAAVAAPQAATRRGLQLLQAGDLAAAERELRQALAHNARDLQARQGLGIIAHRSGHFAAALALFEAVIAADAGFFAAHVNRGLALAALQRFDDAVAGFRRALELSPDLVSARIGLASALHALGALDEAIDALQPAAAGDGASPELLNNLGNLYKDRGELTDALACYRRAIALAPRWPQPFSNMLAALKLDASLSAEALLAQHRGWSNWFEADSGAAPLLVNTPDPARRLRIGYVAPDCHTAVPAFLDAVMTAHDRAQFTVFGYFNNPQPVERLKSLGHADTGRLMRGRSDVEVAAMVHADQIDVMVDIAGHTGHNRLGVFARRAAPVQMTWLDYLCTTGLAAIDYRITDRRADPPGSEASHSETMLRMPHTQWCWQPPVDAPPVSASPLAHDGFVTFGSFNNAQKLTDATLVLWGRLLARLPAARLRLVGVPAGKARQRVLSLLGCDAVRVDFLPRVDPAAYRQAFGNVDIALDPLPFSGATTTLDALWQGVPVLTLPGVSSCSRSSASLLGELELSDWIASSNDDFVERAVALAAEPAQLAGLRGSLRERLRTSTIVDCPRFVRDLEALYRRAWTTWCDERFDPVARPNTFAGSDDILRQAIIATDAGNPAEALTLMQPLRRLRPHWDPLKREYGRAALGWARQHPEALAAWEENPGPPAPRQRISAIVCSIRPEYFSRLSESLAAQFAGHDFELIGIHDASSLCEGYNRGAARARGDLLIFCHDDIDFAFADFGERLVAHLAEHDVVGVIGASRLVDGNWGHAGPPWRHGQIIHRPPDGKGHLYLVTGLHGQPARDIVALDGVFMAARRAVWERVGFDQETFDGFHLYDVDFSYRAHLAGYRIAVPLDLLLIHFSTGRYDVRWQHYNRRFLAKFPSLSNLPSPWRGADLHIKLQTLEQVTRMHAALRHHHFGA